MERRKYMGHAYKEFYKHFTSKVMRVDEENAKGYAAYVHIVEVNRPFIVGEKGHEVCLADDGYSELAFQPDDENWKLSAIYDNHGNIIEYYFDITRKNAVDEEGNPYCDDLYLDAAVMPNGQILILDEDELHNALIKGDINQNEYDMAHQAMDKLMDSKMSDVAYLKALCTSLLAVFEHRNTL